MDGYRHEGLVLQGNVRHGPITRAARWPGKPTDNVFIGSFNGSFRTERITQWFLSPEDARSRFEAWRIDYNEVRPHSSIGQRAPIELVKG